MKRILLISILIIWSSWGFADEETPLHKKNMRHGWTIFTGPKRTIVGVNDEDSIRRGKEIYRKNCQSCHGPKGEGDGPVAREKKIRPANLRALAKNLPNHYLVVQINEGKGEMPSWKDALSTQETWDLTNYIQSLKNK